MDRCFIIFTVIFLIVSSTWAGYPYNRRNNPLQSDDGRKHLRATECHFGKTIRELGSSWFADLGPPFGVMYCIRCECVPVQKKRRIVAKVQCRNIKHECPKPSCDEPVLLPGRCCKLCPNDLYAPEFARDIPITEEDKNMKHFGALLTPRSSLIFKRDDIINIPSTSDKPKYQIVATGRFTFHKKNLYFSFYLANSLNEIPPRPKAIQFINYKGDLLEEQSLANSIYQNATGKVCGVWQRLPREYKRLLRDEGLYVALLWENDLALSGKIARFKALFSEHFTALMTPPSSNIVQPDGGGTAIISLSSLAATNSVHMALVFNGIFAPTDTADVPLTVRLEDSDQIVIHEEIIRVAKPSTELNFEEVRFTLSTADLRQLTRGKSFVTISSKSHPDFMFVRGPILSRATCEIFQTPLSPYTDSEQNSQADVELQSGAGLAWMYMTRDGSLAYNWEIEGAGTDVAVAITHGKGKIIQTFNATNPGSNASGILDRLPPRSVELLYAGELAVRANGDQNLILRGQLIPRPVAGAIDSRRPILLSNTFSTTLVGLAWMNVDLDCNLHYEVQLSGALETNSYRLYLEDTPLMIPNAPVARRLLEDFNGTLLEGFTHLPTPDLAQISSGFTFLEVVDFQTERVLLRGNMKSLKIPMDCLAGIGDNTVPSIALSSDTSSFPSQSTTNKCFHELAFYNDGSQWRHARDPCRMCHCLHGKVHCDQVICPVLNCANPVKISKDQCCPSCTNNSDVNLARGCDLGQMTYPAGSSWHPYLPPKGFDVCVVVSCEASNLSLKIKRIQCPHLTCPEKERIRPNKNACCQICPTPDVTYAKDEPMQYAIRTKEDIMRDGGCVYVGKGPYENNTNWTHSIPSIGPTPCVVCQCKDGKVECKRKPCTRMQCTNHTTFTTDLTTPVDECCSSQCRRYRRQSRHRKGKTAKKN